MLAHSLFRAGLLRDNKLLNVVLSLLIWAAAAQVQAHFTHFEPRIIHVSPQQGGVQLLLRMPLPLLLLDEDWQGGDSGQAVPFTQRERVGDQWHYRIDPADVEQRFAEFEQRVLAGYTLHQDGQRLEGLSLTHVHIFNSDQRKPFSTLATAEAAVGEDRVRVEAGAVELFDSGIDLRLFIPATSLAGSFTIDSDLGTRLKAIERLANILQVHDGRGGSTTFSSIGTLHTSFAAQGYSLAFIGQLRSGVIHILAGLDHVLFVLLIALASANWLQTLQRATAFTLGHSVTLALGMIGYVPLGSWFIPLVETLIALTILYGGIVLACKQQHRFGLPTMLFVGLIHGFGFSIVLSELVSETGGLSVLGLIAFNIGIEFGQLAIYAAVALLLLAYQRMALLRRLDLPVFVSAAAVLVSASWIYERGGLLLIELQSL
ncbi:MAG: HupE/UreJ family protein [Halopseudomonas sp.]